MSELFKAMAVENNNTETENGCPAYKSTLDSLLNLFASGASCRSDSKRLKSLVRKAYSEDKLFCIRILFLFSGYSRQWWSRRKECFSRRNEGTY